MEKEFDGSAIRQIVGKNVLLYMRKFGYCAAQLASLLDCTRGNITALVSGRQFVSARLLAGLCNVFSVTPDKFFTLPSEELDVDAYEDPF